MWSFSVHITTVTTNKLFLNLKSLYVTFFSQSDRQALYRYNNYSPFSSLWLNYIPAWSMNIFLNSLFCGFVSRITPYILLWFPFIQHLCLLFIHMDSWSCSSFILTAECFTVWMYKQCYYKHYLNMYFSRAGILEL